MKLRLIRTAARQLDHVLADLTRHHPSGADAVLQRVGVCLELLLRHPCLRHPCAGQTTDRRGIRRIVVSPYPYILTYRVGADEVIVRTLRHTARRPLA